MLLTRKTEGRAERANPLTRAMSALAAKTVDRRAFLKGTGLTAGAAAFASQLPLGLVGEANAATAAKGGKAETRRTVCTHCSVGCAVDADRPERRLGPPGAGVRFAASTSAPTAPRAPRCASTAMASIRLKSPMKLVDGKWQQDQLGAGDRRGRRQAARDPQGIRARQRLLAGLVQAQQRAGLSVPQVRVDVRHEQRGPPGPHLPLHHGRRRRQHLGLRRDDELVQRHAELQVHVLHRLQRGRGAPGVDAAHAARQGATGAKMIVADPRFTRTAAKADEYVRFRSGTDVPLLLGDALAHLQERLGRQEVHQRPRLRHGQGPRGSPQEVDAGQGRGGHRRARGARLQGRRADGQEPPATIIWCMGQTQHTIGNAMVRASCILQLALGNVGVSGGGTNIFRGHDNVQGATDVGPNPDSLPGYYGLAAGSWKHWCRVWGVDYDWMKARFASQAMMEKPGMNGIPGLALDRRRAGEERAHRPGEQPPRHGLLGPRPQLADARPRDEEGDGEARSAGGDRSVPVRLGRDARPQSGRRLPAAGRHPVRDLGLGAPRRTARSSGARRSSSRSSSPSPTTRSCRPSRRSSASRRSSRTSSSPRRSTGCGRAGPEDHPARDQPRRLDHRLHRPVARSA
jgi:formate dehydrogenase major subunit